MFYNNINEIKASKYKFKKNIKLYSDGKKNLVDMNLCSQYLVSIFI